MSRFIIISLAFVLFTAGKCSKNKYDYTETTYVEVVTTGCFGKCPVYNFKMKGNGMATFNGRMNVEPEGEHSKTFAADTTNVIFDRLIEADLFQYEPEYTDDVTDLPTTYVVFGHEGKQKKIKMYYNVPKALKTTVDDLKTFILSTDWEMEEVDK